MQQTYLSTARARQMRKAMTPAERTLWYALRDRRFLGLKARRQVPIGPFIVDFLIPDRRLVIESDGSGHGAPRDLQRDQWLAARGFRVLRFWNRDILTNLASCLEAIAANAWHTPKD